MKKILKMVLLGILLWLIPFLISFFMYSPEGEPLIDLFLFKSIMIVVGAITGAILLIFYFRKLDKDFLKEGIIVGLTWLVISIILDLVILVPMSGMPVADYFTQIGLRYLTIPAMSIAVGAVAEK